MSSIKKNFLYSSILTTANYIFPLLTFPYVSRVLGVTNIGICNFIDSIINYFCLFSTMGIGVLGIREVAKCKNSKNDLNVAFNTLFAINTVTTFIVFVLLIIATSYINQLRQHWHLMAIGALKLIMNYMLIEWLYKGLEEFKFVTQRTIIVKLFYVLSVFIFIKNGDDYQIYYFLTVMMVVINALINILYSRKYVKYDFKQLKINEYIKPYFVLGIWLLLTSMYTSFNTTYLGFVAGETEVGYYSTSAKLYKIVIALFTAFTGVMLPKISNMLSQNKIEEFKLLLLKSNKILILFSIPVIYFAVLYAPTIIFIIAGKGYEGAIIPMRIMMLLIFIIGYEQILVLQALTPLGKDKAILWTSIIGASVGILLNLILVSTYKSVGSAITWFFSEIFVLISAQYFTNKYIGHHFPWKELFSNLLLSLPCAVLFLINVLYIPNRYLSIIISSILLLFFMAYRYINLFYSGKNKDFWSQIESFRRNIV